MDIILTVIVEYFWDLHCLAVCCLLLFIAFGIAVVFVLLLYIRGHNIDYDTEIFLLVFALFVWVHVFPLSYCMFFNLFIRLLA